MNDLDTFQQILTDNNYRITTARRKVFGILLHPEPQTMREIIERASGEIDRVSVYRCIELFEKLGIVNRIYFGWKYKIELSDKFLSHHHHMICLSCGHSTDIIDEEHIDSFIESLTTEAGFTPVRHIFELEGYCSACTDQKNYS